MSASAPRPQDPAAPGSCGMCRPQEEGVFPVQLPSPQTSPGPALTSTWRRAPDPVLWPEPTTGPAPSTPSLGAVRAPIPPYRELWPGLESNSARGLQTVPTCSLHPSIITPWLPREDKATPLDEPRGPWPWGDPGACLPPHAASASLLPVPCDPTTVTPGTPPAVGSRRPGPDMGRPREV